MYSILSSKSLIAIVAEIIVAIAAALLCNGCDQAFNPQSPFENRLVIYSLLSTDQNTQFVRLYTNYDVQGYDPSHNTVDHPIAGAQIGVSGPEGSYIFRDTLLTRADTDRYKDPIHAYVAAPFQVIPGNRYSLSVVSQGFDRTGVVVMVPQRSEISLVGMSQFDSPSSGDPKDPSTIPIQAHVSAVSKGCLTQVFVEFDVLLDAGWKSERVEIPTLASFDDTSIFIAMYPKLERVISNPMITIYLVKAYQVTLGRVQYSYPHNRLIFRRVVLRVLQVEGNLYDYYNVVNGFRDPGSIRIDEPDYSNFRNGYGIFGAYTLDSLVHELPPNFTFNK